MTKCSYSGTFEVKKGRPKGKNNRDYVFKVRLTAEEYAILSALAERNHSTKAAVFRNYIRENA